MIRRFLPMLFVIALCFSVMSVTALADVGVDYVSTEGSVAVNGNVYNSLTDAAEGETEFKATNDKVVYEVSGKVEYVAGTDLANGAHTVIIAGMDDAAELMITSEYLSTITANGAKLIIDNITINDSVDCLNDESAGIRFDGTDNIVLDTVTLTENVVTSSSQIITISDCVITNYESDESTVIESDKGSVSEVVAVNKEKKKLIMFLGLLAA